MRAHLARLLRQEPDLLLLDEPTNHLDLESLVWFREHLRSYAERFSMISHDRDFPQPARARYRGDLAQRGSQFRGNYDAYSREKAAREEQHSPAYDNQQREIAELQRFADRFRAKASKASQAQSKLKQIERMDLIEAPLAAEAKVKFRFPQPAAQRPSSPSRSRTWTTRTGRSSFIADSISRPSAGSASCSWGRTAPANPPCSNCSAACSTLQRGTRELGHNVTRRLLSPSTASETLNFRQHVLEAAQDMPAPRRDNSPHGARLFLFRGDDVFQAGRRAERRREVAARLARLLLDPPNLLLMDEPTTHLDIPSIDASSAHWNNTKAR
jgi:ATP-binding cassette subfamily F protein 3